MTETIKLIDLIKQEGITLGHFKIHCATNNSELFPPPLDVFLQGNFKEWQELQTKRNFQCDKIVSLIQLREKDKWLFAGVYAIEGVRVINKGEPYLPWYPNGYPNSGAFKYSTRKLNGLENLIGRTIVKFEKNFRASYLRGEKYGGNLFVFSTTTSNKRIS